MSEPTMTGIGAVLGKRAAKHARKQARKRQRTAGGWRAPVAPEASSDAGGQAPATLEAPADDERGPGIENGKGAEGGVYGARDK